MEALSSRHVRSHGPFCCLSCSSWLANIQRRRDARSYRPQLASIAGISLYPWSWTIRCKYLPNSIYRKTPDSIRLDGRNGLHQGPSIFGGVLIRSFMCWLSWQPRHICMAYYWLLTTTMESLGQGARGLH